MKRIRLTESQLYNLIQKTINEGAFKNGLKRAFNYGSIRSLIDSVIEKYRLQLNDYEKKELFDWMVKNGHCSGLGNYEYATNGLGGIEEFLQERGWLNPNESLVRRVTENVYMQLRKLDEAQKGDNNGWPIYDMGCNYEDANFDEISQIIGDCTGKRFKTNFFSNEQWDSNDLQSKIYFKFNDIDGDLVVIVGGGYYTNYDDDDTPIGLEIWMGMGNYTIAEENDDYYNPYSDLAKDMREKVDWQKVEKVISSYSIDEPTPEFLDAFDTGMEKQVLGYNRETSQRARPSAPQFVGNESFAHQVTKGVIKALNEWTSRGKGFEVGDAFIDSDYLYFGKVQMNCGINDPNAVSTFTQILRDATDELIMGWDGAEWESANRITYDLYFTDIPMPINFDVSFSWEGEDEEDEGNGRSVNITNAWFGDAKMEPKLNYSDDEEDVDIDALQEVIDKFNDSIDYNQIALDCCHEYA